MLKTIPLRQAKLQSADTTTRRNTDPNNALKNITTISLISDDGRTIEEVESTSSSTHKRFDGNCEEDYEDVVSDLEVGEVEQDAVARPKSVKNWKRVVLETGESSDEDSLNSELWAYRSYDPTKPCTNRLIQQKWDEETKRAHLEKLKKATATIDTAPPKKYTHLVSQHKRHQMRVEEALRIYHDNTTLVERIRRQVRTTNQPSGRPTDPHPVIMVNPVVQRMGLNGPRKRILQEQMEFENEVILHRLENSDPFYKQEQFSKERINTLLHLQNISRFPKRYVQQLKEAGVQFPRVSEKKPRPISAQTDTAGIISKSELKDPHLYNYVKKQAIIKAPPNQIEKGNSSDSISVPPRYQPKAPLVPRVAKLLPRKIIPLESLLPPKPVKRVPLVPRCAKLPPRPVTAPEPVKPKPPPKPSVYDEEDPPGKYIYEDEFPGDEDLIITSDSWTKVTHGKALTRLNNQGFVEERHQATRYNFGDAPGEQNLLTGVPAFGSGYEYPRISNYSFKIYVSSIDGDADEERSCWNKNYLLQLRQFCMCFGKEVLWRDYKFGRDSVVTDLDNYRKICLSEMETCQKESTFISSMIFFNNTHYGERALPTDIDAEVFKKLLNQAKHMDFRELMSSTNNKSAEELLKKWYRLDDNCIPRRFLLRKVNEVVTNIDSLDERESAKKIWLEQNLAPLKQILRSAAVRLGRHGLLEAHIVQRFVQSDFQEEIIRGVVQEYRRGGWERSVMMINAEELPKIMMQSRSSDTDIEQDEQEEPEPVTAEEHLTQDQKLLKKIISPLFTAIPYENKIIPEAKTDKSTKFDKHEKIVPMLDNLLDRFKRLISRHVLNRPRPDNVLNEIITHMKVFKAKARDHSHRGHLVDKMMGYLNRPQKCSIPPFLLDGDASMGKTAVLGKTLQKFVRKVTEEAWERVRVTRLNADSEEFITGRMSILASEPADPDPNVVPFEPVIVARICGLTPASSNARLLIDSISRQIFEAFFQRIESTDLLTVHDYRKAISLASSERPIVIVLAKIDRLCSEGPLSMKISWILDHIPPFVRIVFSARSDLSTTSPFSVITHKIKLMAPAVLYSVAASENRAPPSPALLAVCHEDYFLNVGTIIAPIAKSSIKRLLAVDSRKLRLDQEEALRNAFSEAEIAENGKYVPIRMLKQIYKMSTRWGSWEKVGDIEFPKTLSEAFDLELSEFEINHGYYFTLTILSLLVLSRDGLTISELEDIISLDNLCLCESLKVFETDLARIPPLKVTQFLHDINDYVVRRQDFGGELISIAHDHDLVKCIEERYLSDREIVDRISNLLLDYFSDKFSEEYPFTSIKGRDFLPSRLILGMPWRYPPNELCEKAFGTATTWNVRKLRELPHACLMADNWIEFDRLLHDVHYVTGILSVQSTDRAIEEVYSFFVHDPKKYRPDRQSRFAPQSEPKLETDAPKLELEDGDIKVEESEPEQHFVVTPRIKVLIFLETFLDFLVWCRHIMDLSPQETRKSVVFDMLFRLPESSNLKGVLYRTISQSELVKSGNWDKFNLLQSCGYGILQCISSWRPIISVSGKVWSARLPPLITNPDGETRSDIDVSTMPDWSSARQKSMTLGSSICTIDGEYNYEQWDQTHIKPSMTILHRNHTHSACSSDGKYIASSSNDGFVKVFDASTGFELASLNTIGKVMAIAFQAQDNDNLLISVALSSSINKLLVWSMSKCQVTHEVSGKLMGLGVPIVICGFLKDIASQRDHHHHQQLIIYGLGLNGVLTIWELNTSVIVKQFYPDSDDNKVLATGTATASSDGKFIVYGIRSLNLINVKDLSLVWTLKIQPDKSDLKNHVMNRLIFSQDSKTVFILSSSYKTSIQSPSPVFQKFDLTNKVTSMLWPLEINANDMAITPDEECVAFGSESGIAHIVSLKSGSLLVCQALAEPVNSMIVIPEIPSSTYSSSTYARKTNWTGNMKEEDKCYILGIGSFKTGINLFGFENSRDSKIRHSISTAQLSPDGSILAVVGGSEVPHLNYDASCFIQAPKLVRVDGEVVSSLEDIQALTRQARSLQAATSVPGKSGTTRGRSVSLERRASKIMAKTQQTPLSDPTKENVKKSYFDEPKDRSTVTLWDVETGSRLFKTDYKGKVVWVDFETKTFGTDVSSFVTGDTGGDVKIWNWNTIGQVNEGKVCRNWASTAVSTEIETLSFNVANGLSNATVMNYCLNRENGILAVLVMEETGTLKAQFWTTEKGERVESHEIRIESGPIFNMTKSGLSIPMCWGNPSDVLLRFVNTQHAVSAHTIRPACLTVGLDRLHISIDFAQSRSESIKAMVESRIGSTYTATCQSKADPRLMVIAVSDKIYLIYEEMFPVVGKPTPIAPYHRLSMAVPSAPDSQRASVSAKDKKKGKSRNNLVDIKKSSSNLCKSTTAIKEKEKDGVDSASDTFSEPARSHRPSLAPIEKEYVPSPSDFCRIRTFKAVEGETVIGLHHFKTDLSDVLISATSNGTVVVYDLKLNTRKTGIHHQVIDEPVKIIGIWHARAPISGMQVTEVVRPKNEDEEESDDEEYSRCRVVVWGLNGFVSVLNLQL